jgi:hypothetical protein
LTTPPHKDAFRAQFTLILAKSNILKVPVAPLAPAAAAIDIPLTTVSRIKTFDAYLNITYPGAPAGTVVTLLVDSGNFSLIVPDFTTIAALPSFKKDYIILAGNVNEPWGCPAKILQGPIQIPTRDGSLFQIRNCVFYACTGPNSKGYRTANFGAGRLSPWIKENGVPIQAPLAYNAAYPYAVFKYAPAEETLTAESDPSTSAGSSLTLLKSMPAGYKMFDIMKNLEWMSLIPRSLSIGVTKTGWPGKAPSPIAMVDTGGGPVFLSDPEGYVYKTQWPDQVPPPDWTAGSDSCQATKDNLNIALGDEKNSFSYTVDTTAFPPSVQGLTLVMCKVCEYMRGQQGMNIGGISALSNYILIDYASARVGFKPKPLELV